MGDQTNEDENEITCNRCGATYSARTIAQHTKVCERIPLADELCDMLDQHAKLSIRALAKKVECSYGFLLRRLEGSRWDQARLRKRGNRAKSLVQRHRPGPSVDGPTCSRCSVLLAKTRGRILMTRFGPLCHDCYYELGEIARRLANGSFFSYRLNRPDCEFFRRYNPLELRLI